MADTTGNDIYWLNFRLAEVNTTKGDYQKRYEKLVEVLQGLTVGSWWVEGTSLVVFRSSVTLDDMIAKIKGAISEAHDIVVIGMPYWKTMRLVGAAKDAATLQALVDFMKKV